MTLQKDQKVKAKHKKTIQAFYKRFVEVLKTHELVLKN